MYTKTKDILRWLKQKNEETKVIVEKIPLGNLNKWNLSKKELHHDTRKFFSIIGVSINTNWGGVPSWSQPIIYQPEIGILGIISKSYCIQQKC